VRPLVINATELLRDPGTRKHVVDVVDASEIGAEHATVAGDIAVAIDLESTLDDIGVTGAIEVPWHGHCRRCLKPMTETIVVDVDERYADAPGPGDDAFPIERGHLDLRPMVREEVLLAADELRLCRPDCPGLCPVCGRDVSVEPCDCDTTLVDERWSVLDQLRDDT